MASDHADNSSKATRTDVALLLLRLAFGFRLVWGAFDTVLSWDDMLEFADWLDGYGFPVPLVSAIVSAYAQLFAGLAWMIGLWVRPFSILMIFNFVVAILFVHIAGGTPYVETAPAVHMLIFAAVLLLIGPGKLVVGTRKKWRTADEE